MRYMKMSECETQAVDFDNENATKIDLSQS